MEVNSTSPDGNYRLETDSIEFRMSHWVDRPRLSNLHTGKTILDLGGTDWDVMNYKWKEDGTLWMELRKYPGDCESIAITLHLDTRRVTCPYFECTAKDVERNLNKFYKKHRIPD
jgi:hypothetical protein